MNLIISLQKLLGSKQTKIKAIGFEIEKLEDELKFFVSRFNSCEDRYEKQYYESVCDDIASSIEAKHQEIEVLQNV